MRYAAAFLDRDGTINRDVGYVDDPADVQILPGSAEAIALLNARSIPVVVVTNQSGVGRGLYSEADFEDVQVEVERQLAQRSCALDAVYRCLHDPSEGCDCRKPALGLYRTAAREHGIELARSLYVGDKVSDVLPAVKLGGTGYLLRTGAEVEVDVPEGVQVAEDLLAAVRHALADEGRESG